MAPSSPSASYIARLPAEVRAMVEGLPAEEQEVFSYLASYSAFDSGIGWKVCKKPKKHLHHHQQQQQQHNASKPVDHDRAFACDCLDCYLKYWQLWVSSPNTAVIDKALELLESTSTTSRKSSWIPKKKRSNPKNSSSSKCKECKESESSPAAAAASPEDPISVKSGKPPTPPSKRQPEKVKEAEAAAVSKPRSKQVAPLDFKVEVDLLSLPGPEGGGGNEDGSRAGRSFGSRASEALGFVCEKLLWMWNPRLRRRQ